MRHREEYEAESYLAECACCHRRKEIRFTDDIGRVYCSRICHRAHWWREEESPR
jgi:hypothetical protein